MANCGIYFIINIINGRHYVGSTDDFIRRQNEHFSLLRNKSHPNPFLQNDFVKCGEEAFKFIRIMSIFNEELDFWEQIFIDRLYDDQKICYNILKTAHGSPMKGRKHTVETLERMRVSHRNMSAKTKEKMSRSHTGLQSGEKNPMFGKVGEKHPRFGKCNSEETRKKIGIGNKNKVLSVQAKQKISVSLIGNKRALGYVHSEETRKKLSVAHKGNKCSLGHKHSIETRKKMSESRKLFLDKRGK